MGGVPSSRRIALMADPETPEVRTSPFLAKAAPAHPRATRSRVIWIVILRAIAAAIH